jgi:hypothetical protein
VYATPRRSSTDFKTSFAHESLGNEILPFVEVYLVSFSSSKTNQLSENPGTRRLKSDFFFSLNCMRGKSGSPPLGWI